jgi:alpha-D-ribose 1-methylphosphonate 5-triphosphate diphosphatase
MDIRIDGGRALIGGDLHCTSIGIRGDDGTIAEIGATAGMARRIDAAGLMVLPGIVDIHGDAFERQLMPRPGVHFPIDVALHDTDRQVVANGITTVFHGVTWSWEPGLRGSESARAMLEALERLRPALAADTRYHLRYETYNLDAADEVAGWLANRRIGMLAFNDHLTPTVEVRRGSNKISQMAERAGLSTAEFEALVERTQRRGNEVPGSIARLADAAKSQGVPMLSHDDISPAQRRWFRSLGCRVSEFPMTAETAQDAADQGDDIVFGAPNVVRGGSHIGWTKAADMVERGLCTVLASDYYYPAQLLAAFRLAQDKVTSLERAWQLVSEAPARAAGLDDRGRIEQGQRADLILVDATEAQRPRIVGTIVAGRIVHWTEAGRLSH